MNLAQRMTTRELDAVFGPGHLEPSGKRMVGEPKPPTYWTNPSGTYEIAEDGSYRPQGGKVWIPPLHDYA